MATIHTDEGDMSNTSIKQGVLARATVYQEQHASTRRLPWAAWIALVSLMNCSEAQPLYQPTSDSSTTLHATTDAGAVSGFADLHFHMMAEEAFGGAWMHGQHTGNLYDCDGGLPPSDHARVRQDLRSVLEACPAVEKLDFGTGGLLSSLFSIGGIGASELIGKVEGSDGDTGLHLLRSTFPSGWPRWDTIAHQQGHGNWLRQAHERGLALVVISAVSFDWLCQITPPQNRKRVDCDEMADIDVQLALAQRFADNNASWFQIARTPAEARQIIGAGKLAVVLSIEASHLFGRDVNASNLLERLEHYYELGVRSIQPSHEVDNAFAGAALHNPMLHVAEFTENCHVDTDCAAGLTIPGLTLGFDVGKDCKNTRGLTTLGQSLVGAMMDRAMLVDLAHLSERGMQDVYELAVARQYYPLFVSHGHFREIMAPQLAAQEKPVPASVVELIRKTGGMFGLRTAHEKVRTYLKGGVDNNCHGSSRSFAQAYQFGSLGLKVPIAFGSDLNGFVAQTRPRFGNTGACSASFKAEADLQMRAQQEHPPGRLGTNFDEKGLAHIGLLPDLLLDLQHLGVDTSGIERSAESFLLMWERAQGPRAGTIDTSDLDVGGIGP